MKMSVFTLHLCNISQQLIHPVLGLIQSPKVPLVQQIPPPPKKNVVCLYQNRT